MVTASRWVGAGERREVMRPRMEMMGPRRKVVGPRREMIRPCSGLGAWWPLVTRSRCGKARSMKRSMAKSVGGNELPRKGR